MPITSEKRIVRQTLTRSGKSIFKIRVITMQPLLYHSTLNAWKSKANDLILKIKYFSRQ